MKRESGKYTVRAWTDGSNIIDKGFEVKDAAQNLEVVVTEGKIVRLNVVGKAKEKIPGATVDVGYLTSKEIGPIPDRKRYACDESSVASVKVASGYSEAAIVRAPGYAPCVLLLDGIENADVVLAPAAPVAFTVKANALLPEEKLKQKILVEWRLKAPVLVGIVLVLTTDGTGLANVPPGNYQVYIENDNIPGWLECAPVEVSAETKSVTLVPLVNKVIPDSVGMN